MEPYDFEPLTIPERVARLEERMKDLSEIKEKLDQLLELKSKGMGAIGLVSLIVGSGVIGLAITLWNVFFPRNHV